VSSGDWSGVPPGLHFSVNFDEIVKLNYTPKLKEIENTLQIWSKQILTPIGKITIIKSLIISKLNHVFLTIPSLTRIIQSLYYSPASRCINAWMHSLKKSVKPEIVNRYDLWVLRHKIGGAKVFVNNVQWSDQMM
jgi:hypothetical protein